MKILLVSSSKDSKRAETLSAELTKAGCEIFDPHLDIRAGDNVFDAIVKEASMCDIVVVLASADLGVLDESTVFTDRSLAKFLTGLPEGKKCLGFQIRPYFFLPQINGLKIITTEFGSPVWQPLEIVGYLRSKA